MRVKVLLELIGCEVELLHFSMIDDTVLKQQYDLVAASHGVPTSIIEELMNDFSQEHFLLLAPKAQRSDLLEHFSEINRLLPNAVVIYPFFANKEISTLLEGILELDSDNILKLPTVLLVDHCPDRLQKIAQNLKGAHIKTITADNMSFAMELIHEHAIDLLISDFTFEDGTGLELFIKLKSLQPESRCLLYTSKPDQVSMVAAIRQGVEDVLIKPIDDNGLLQSVHKLWQTELLKRHNSELVERLQSTVDALIEKDSLLRVIFKHTPDAIILFERCGKVIETNDACEQLFDKQHHEFESCSVFDFFDAPSITRIKEKITTLSKNRQFSCDLRMLNKDGNDIPLVGSFNEIDHHGEIALAGIFKNVTHLKEKEDLLLEAKDLLEEEVKARTAQLEHAKDVAEAANLSKSEFLANMSHELRTPMHSILSFARFGLDKVANNDLSKDKLNKYLSRIEQSGERLLSLLNNLLDLSKLDVGKFPFNPQKHNLSSIIKTSIDDVSGTALERNIAIRLIGFEKSILLDCDEEQINQIMRNLLGNALKFSEPASEIDIQLTMNNEMAEISVIDRGIGIPESELEKIFAKFEQSSKTNSGAGGTGLGLAICREFVALHQGTITARNNEYGGATILVKLPLRIDLPQHLANEDRSVKLN
ncbi:MULTISPECIES: ATP-binding protein [unclassified Pseudoalteromonas]|uniref:sensor histidine kinase n=1 Tax=unclassified Pseudoalteromonas TaxID=194690 RepID=UPI00110B02E1|nr:MULTISPECIES: ATP-binding protein [unclassified Pseudoalteromonas]TMP46982.1 hybrid sensor histidine kinase/response regulator [Pseudoalteromonas sp. S1650]TMP69902.1 hybrid sensor histidine kinase/response regulator [Pseudoalteromonas sp. S1649]